VIELRAGKPQFVSGEFIRPWRFPAVPPTVLHVCRETRREALRFYELAFGRCDLPPRISVNFTKDVIYFDERTGWENMLLWVGHTDDLE
jgi:hypothetical protein